MHGHRLPLAASLLCAVLAGCASTPASSETELRTVAGTPYGVGVNAEEWARITVGSQALCVTGGRSVTITEVTWAQGTGVKVTRVGSRSAAVGSTLGAVAEPMEDFGYSTEQLEVSTPCSPQGELGESATTLAIEVESRDPDVRQRVEGLLIRYRTADGQELAVSEPLTLVICARSNIGQQCQDG